jgi:hypothetical protein
MSTTQMSHEHATHIPAPVTVDPKLEVVPEEAADAGAGHVAGARR